MGVIKIKSVEERELHKLKNAMESICMFMGQVKSEISDLKPNLTTKDYTLHQYQCHVGREIAKYENILKQSF